MKNKVRTYIEHEIGLQANALVHVAVSGGADSTALLLIMRELGYRVHALHCNFYLRGEESDRDQAFVEELCRQQDVPLSVRHFRTEAVNGFAKRGIALPLHTTAKIRPRRCCSTCFVEQVCVGCPLCSHVMMASYGLCFV